MENNNHELINLISSLVEEYFNSKEFELKIACIDGGRIWLFTK